MVRRRRLASGGRDLQERALQEHGDLAHLARQLAAEKAMVGKFLVEGSCRTINQWPGVCIVACPFFGVLEKKHPSPKFCIISMFWCTCLKFEKRVCNFEISINSLYFAFAWSLSHLPRLRGVGRTFSSNPGAVAGELAIQSQLFASTFEACETGW